MKNIIVALVVVIMLIVAVVNITTTDEPVAIVRSYDTPNYAVLFDEFDPNDIQEGDKLYIQWTNTKVDPLDMSDFAWRDDKGQLILTHSGLDWWLERQHGIITQNEGGDRWGTWLTDEGMFLYDVENDVSWKIPFVDGIKFAVAASTVEAVLHQAGIL